MTDSKPACWPKPGDELLMLATGLLQGERSVSISYLQRHLRLGYSAALGLRAELIAIGLLDPLAETSGQPEGATGTSSGTMPSKE